MQFILNIFSIDDVARWRETFSWPVLTNELRDIELAVHKSLVATIRGADGNARIAGRLAAGWLYTQLTDWIALALFVDRACKDGVEFVFTNCRLDNGSVPAKNMLADVAGGASPQFQFFDRFFNEIYLRKSPFLMRRLRQSASWVKQQQRLNPKGFFSGKTLVVHPNPDVLSYVAKKGISFRLIRVSKYFETYSLETVQKVVLDAGHKKMCADIVKSVSDISFEYIGKPYPTEWNAIFVEGVERLIKLITLDLGRLSRVLPDFSGKEILTGTHGNYFTRLISHVIRSKGGNVVTFPHGGGSTGVFWNKFPLTEFEIPNEFALYGDKELVSAMRYETIDNNVTFRMCKGVMPSVLERADGFQRPPIELDAINTVMYVAPGYFGDRQGAQVIPEVVHFDLELRIVEYFLSLGKRVIYKLRPKTRLYGKGFRLLEYFENKNVIFEERPFSNPDVYNATDLFVFSKVSSTALYEAIHLTNTPILLYLTGSPSITDEFIKMNRVHVCDLFHDERGRLLFDAPELTRKLARWV
ncbi:MAG: hypothetical protein AB7E47_04085 [Desulfovibrionaceae bacterium]